MFDNHRCIKRFGYVLSYALIIVLVALFVPYVLHHKAQFAALKRVSLLNFVLICFMVLPFKFFTSLRFKIMMEFFGVRLKAREWLGLPSISTMANYILPARAGVIPQAMYLKQVYGVEYPRFAAYLASLAIFTLVVNAVSGLLFLVLYYLLKGQFFFGLFLIFAGLTIVSLASVAILPHLHKFTKRFALIHRVTDGLTMMEGKRRVLVKLFFVQLGDILFTGLRLFMAYRAIGAQVSLTPVLMIGLFASISAIVSITPANLGVRELSITISTLLIGESAASGLMASLVDRATGALMTFVVGLPFLRVLSLSGKKGNSFGDLSGS